VQEKKKKGMALIKKMKGNDCRQGCGEKGTLAHCYWESKLLQPLWKTEWSIIKKLKIQLPHEPAIPLLAYIQRK
jgi:hypothetical protein